LLIAMPMRDKPTRETLWALKDATPGHTLFTEVGLPDDEARNALAKRILEHESEEFVAWIDDEAWCMPGSIDNGRARPVSPQELQVLKGVVTLGQVLLPDGTLPNADNDRDASWTFVRGASR